MTKSSWTRLDHAPILELLEAGTNPAEIANRLGLAYTTVNQIARRHRGTCTRCGSRPQLPGRTKCRKCLEWHRKYEADKRKQAHAENLCACGKPRKTGSTLCSDCYERGVKRTLRSRMKNFGPHAEQILSASSGVCQACGDANDRSPDIHHIDENPRNNSRENLICLCSNCHRAVHRLISSRDRRALISRFEKTYPAHTLR